MSIVFATRWWVRYERQATLRQDRRGELRRWKGTMGLVAARKKGGLDGSRFSQHRSRLDNACAAEERIRRAAS
ncbi:hypothetical protein L484_006888 [Morus notabilis]|uniref:Uncharacterized protein n=1 Tax=Morus notabilis TaxID=981085 RepID=W9S5K2_9ROSA|nr:hypothetical protein L484_006888 [Morus notabilis]